MLIHLVIHRLLHTHTTTTTALEVYIGIDCLLHSGSSAGHDNSNIVPSYFMLCTNSQVQLHSYNSPVSLVNSLIQQSMWFNIDIHVSISRRNLVLNNYNVHKPCKGWVEFLPGPFYCLPPGEWFYSHKG